MTTMRERCKQAIMRSDAWLSFFDDEAAGVFVDAMLDEMMVPASEIIEEAENAHLAAQHRAGCFPMTAAWRAAILAAKEGK